MYQRIYSIDYMRIMLAAFVVIGHAGMGRETFGVYGLITLNTILRLAVPLFAMTAGFFLLRTRQRNKYWLWTRRMAVLYVVWYLIYFLFMGLWHQGVGQSLRELLLGFRHLWFLEGLVVAAVMMHFMVALGPRVMLWSAILLAGVGVALEYAAVGHLIGIPLEIFRSGPFFIYPFMVMGYLFASKLTQPDSVPWSIPARPALIAVMMAGFLLALAENAFFLTTINEYALLEYQIGMFIMAPAIFALVLNVRAPETDLPLGVMASAIYVMHYLFLHFAAQMHVPHPLPAALAAFLVPAALVLLMVRLGRGQRWMAQLF